MYRFHLRYSIQNSAGFILCTFIYHCVTSEDVDDVESNPEQESSQTRLSSTHPTPQQRRLSIPIFKNLIPTAAASKETWKLPLLRLLPLENSKSARFSNTASRTHTGELPYCVTLDRQQVLLSLLPDRREETARKKRETRAYDLRWRVDNNWFDEQMTLWLHQSDNICQLRANEFQRAKECDGFSVLSVDRPRKKCEWLENDAKSEWVCRLNEARNKQMTLKLKLDAVTIDIDTLHLLLRQLLHL